MTDIRAIAQPSTNRVRERLDARSRCAARRLVAVPRGTELLTVKEETEVYVTRGGVRSVRVESVVTRDRL